MVDVCCCLGKERGESRWGRTKGKGEEEKMLTVFPLPAIRWSILPSIAFTFM